LKKLYDETHEYSENDFRRTIWYLAEENDKAIEYIFSEPNEYGGRMIEANDYSELTEKLGELIGSDVKETAGQDAGETHWIFYSNIVDGDAIEDKVRFSIFVRLKGGRYVCSINMSDFIFASSFDEVLKAKEAIEGRLNR
jgi:hypothetical protein